MLVPVLAGAGPAFGQALALPMVIRPDTPAYGMGAHGPEAAAARARDGHFYFDGQVNGAPLHMMFDTGATMVVLRAEEAAGLGIDPSTLSYSQGVRTANGRTQVAAVLLPRLTVGGITRLNVPAAVARAGQLSINLLGQSFLARLPGYRQDGDRLVLLGGG